MRSPQVKCYGCGHHYEVTDPVSAEHTSHAIALGYQPRHTNRPLPVGYRPSAGELVVWLEECQRERDNALRLLAHDNLFGEPGNLNGATP